MTIFPQHCAWTILSRPAAPGVFSGCRDFNTSDRFANSQTTLIPPVDAPYLDQAWPRNPVFFDGGVAETGPHFFSGIFSPLPALLPRRLSIAAFFFSATVRTAFHRSGTFDPLPQTFSRPPPEDYWESPAAFGPDIRGYSRTFLPM